MYVFQRNVGYEDVVHESLVHFFKGKSWRVYASAVADGNVPVSSIAFSSELDASANPVYFFRNVGSIKESAEFVTCDYTISYEDMFTSYCTL